MIPYLVALIVFCLAMMVFHGARGNEPQCKSWAWATLGMWVIFLVVYLITEQCNECYSTGQLKQNNWGELETSSYRPWGGLQQGDIDLQVVPADLPHGGRHEANRHREHWGLSSM